MDQLDQTLVNTTVIQPAKTWRPIRPIVSMVQPLPNELVKVMKKVTPVKPAGQTTSTTGIFPQQLLSLSATESPSKQQDRTFSQVAVSFIRDSNDPAFGYVNIWLEGYKGNPHKVLQCSSSDSPIYFLLETTKETIRIIGQPVSPSGLPAAIELARTCTVTLDGVVSAPPAPSIAESLIATPSGYQFAFNQLPAQEADVISCYRVYRNTSNNPLTATLVRTYPDDPTNTGPIVVQDSITGATFYFYWVSAVNTVGLESTLTPAQSGAVDALGRAQAIFVGIASSLPLVTSGTTPTASYKSTLAISLPGAFEVYGYFSGAVDQALDVLLWASDTSSKPNGYIYRLDNRSGNVAGQILKSTGGTFTSIGTAQASANAARLTPGWYKLRGEWGADGTLNVYINDIWQATCKDSTYTPTGATYVGAEASATGLAISDTGGSTGLNNQGSIAGMVGLGFTYTSTTTSITWSWASGTIYNPDGSTISVSSGSAPAFTGLTAGTTYYFGAYWDIASASMIVAISDTSSGTAICSVQQQAQIFNADGHIPVGINFTGATPASGTGSGGGEPRSCFSGNTLVRTNRGTIAISEIKPGDFVLTARFTWRKVKEVIRAPHDGDVYDMGDGELVTPEHPIRVSGRWVPAKDVVGVRPQKFTGEVWNLHVDTEDELERSYILGNGYTVHNQSIIGAP